MSISEPISEPNLSSQAACSKLSAGHLTRSKELTDDVRQFFGLENCCMPCSSKVGKKPGGLKIRQPDQPVLPFRHCQLNL